MNDHPLGSDVRRYRVRGVLGKGGFGTVYLADLLGQSGFVRAVALKVLHADMEDLPSVAARLRDEARLLGLLRHRAIVGVQGLARLDGRWAIVMDYVEGVPLSRLIEGDGVPLGPALEVAGEVASALDVAYGTPGPDGKALHLLHRDIKPHNVIVTPNGETKVLDFGVARAEFQGREANTRNMLLGSPAYMAPERYDLEDGPGADVYALGVMLFELVTGEEYGRASAQREKYQPRYDEGVRRLRAVDIPLGVRDLIAETLQFEPDRRPTARELERRCRDLRLEVRGPWLRDWAERAIPPLMVDLASLPPHDFSHDVLSEARSLGLPPPPPPSPATPAPPPTPDPPSPRRSLPTFTVDAVGDGRDPVSAAPTMSAPPRPPPPPSTPRPVLAPTMPPPPPGEPSKPPPPPASSTPVSKPPSPGTKPPTPPSPSKPAGPARGAGWADDVARMKPERPTAPFDPPAETTTRRRAQRRRGSSGVAVFLQAFGGVSLAALIVGGVAVAGFFGLCCLGMMQQ
jgi:serine/threonine protein kinase